MSVEQWQTVRKWGRPEHCWWIWVVSVERESLQVRFFLQVRSDLRMQEKRDWDRVPVGGRVSGRVVPESTGSLVVSSWLLRDTLFKGWLFKDEVKGFRQTSYHHCGCNELAGNNVVTAGVEVQTQEDQLHSRERHRAAQFSIWKNKKPKAL